MIVLAASEDSASLKYVSFSRDTDTTNPELPKPEIKTYLASKGDPIIKLMAVPDRQLLVILRKSGHVGLYDSESFELKYKYEDKPTNAVGIFLVSPKKFCIVTAEGHGAIYEFETARYTKFKTDGNLTVATNCSTRQSMFLVAGEEVLPQVFEVDVKHGIPIRTWQAKRPPKTNLGLKEPNSVISACFINENRVVTSTRHGKLRLYDIASASSSRPLHQSEVSKYRVPSLVPIGPESVVFGDSQAKLALWSTRPWRLLGHFSNVMGSTRALATHNEFIAAAGLDRYLRVFATNTRKPAGKVYLGEEVSALVFIQDDNEKTLADDDEMWGDIAKRRRVETDFSSEEEINADEGKYMMDSSSSEIVSDSSYSERSDIADSDEFCGFSE